MSKVNSNYAVIIFLFNMQACWVSGMYVDLWDNLHVCTASIWKDSWNRWWVSLHSVWITDELWNSWCISISNMTEVSPVFTFYENVCKWHAVSKSQNCFSWCFSDKCSSVNRLFPECIWVRVHMLNTHCADWQAVPALLIQICSAEAVQKVSQLPDWKD